MTFAHVYIVYATYPGKVGEGISYYEANTEAGARSAFTEDHPTATIVKIVQSRKGEW